MYEPPACNIRPYSVNKCFVCQYPEANKCTISFQKIFTAMGYKSACRLPVLIKFRKTNINILQSKTN